MNHKALSAAIYDYFKKQGKTISPNILQILDKTLLELTDEEQATYEMIVLPSWKMLRGALKAQLGETASGRKEWEAQIKDNPYAIISKIAEEALAEHDQEQKEEEKEALQKAQLIPHKASEVKKASSTRGSWYHASVIVLVCVVVAGVAVGSVFAYKAIWGEGSSDLSNEAASGSSHRYITYLKDGNICYCSIGDDSSSEKGVLVDEAHDIYSFDVDPQGKDLVYMLEDDTSQSSSSYESVELKIFHPENGKVEPYTLETGGSIGSPRLDSDLNIWFSTIAGDSGTIWRFSSTESLYEEIAEGWLIDINQESDIMLVSRFYGHPPVEETFLINNRGEVMQDYGDTASSERVAPISWAYKSERLVGIISSLSPEISLLTEDSAVEETYKVPGECGYPISSAWDETSSILVFYTRKGKLYVVNTKNKESPKLLDSGVPTSSKGILDYSPQFIEVTAVLPYTN